MLSSGKISKLHLCHFATQRRFISTLPACLHRTLWGEPSLRVNPTPTDLCKKKCKKGQIQEARNIIIGARLVPGGIFPVTPKWPVTVSISPEGAAQPNFGLGHQADQLTRHGIEVARRLRRDGSGPAAARGRLSLCRSRHGATVSLSRQSGRQTV